VRVSVRGPVLRPHRRRSNVLTNRMALTGARKLAVICCCVVATAVSACGAHENGTVKASNEPTSRLTAGSLIVSVEDVRRIADFSGLTPEPALDLHQPGHSDSDAPASCRAVFDQQVTFDGGWTQFRSVTYNGEASVGPAPVLNGVAQAVGVYPDDAAARTAFDHLVSALSACSAAHANNYEVTVHEQDPSTVALHHEQFDSVYRVKSSVLIEVEVSQFPQSGRIASSVLQTITDRITP
jgi:hypothetical protein